MTRVRLFLVLIISISISFTALANTASTNSLNQSTARISRISSLNHLNSSNWAGYAISAPSNSITTVRGSWIEPAVTCPTSSLQLASFWVGMDGLFSNTVEQTGTLAFCKSGLATYSAWYEFYPNYSQNITSLPIHAGDVISATVKYSVSTSKFTTIIKDVTTGKSFSHTEAFPGAVRSSAEWIAEAPGYSSCTGNSYLCPLANFGTISFGKDTTLVTGTDTATISGVTMAIGKFGPSVDSLEMVKLADTTVKALSSNLSRDGTSFSVAWVSAGP
jgi:hypothetical protein